MSESSEEKKNPPLVEITDLLGISGSSTRLVDAIVRGVGELTYPWVALRKAKTNIEIYKQWSKVLKKTGLLASSADLAISDSAIIQLLTNANLHQENRQIISSIAVEAFKAEHGTDESTQAPIDDDWLDRYWRHAERVFNADFQILWGRILARQALGTQNFTPRCLEALSLLTKAEAATLEQLAPMVTAVETSKGNRRYFLVYDVESEAKPNMTAELVAQLSEATAKLQRIIGPWHEQMFAPIGIYASSEGSWAISVPAPVIDGAARLSIAGVCYRLEGHSANATFKTENYPTDQSRSLEQFRLVNIGHGLPFSAIGGEILSLLRVNPREEYVDALKSAYAVAGLSMSLDEGAPAEK